LEVKLRGTHTARTLFDEVKALARKEGKVPILALVDKHRPGALICLQSDDLTALVAELATKAQPPADPPRETTA
jgi:hypothetical protein